MSQHPAGSDPPDAPPPRPPSFAASWPTTPRVFAGLAAGAIAFWFGVVQADGLARLGCAAAALVGGATASVAALFLALLAFAPGAIERPLKRVSRADLHDGGDFGALVVLACALFFVLGWGAIVTATAATEIALGGCSLEGQIPTSGATILVSVAINFAVFTLPVLIYVAFVHDASPRSALDKLGLRPEGALRALGVGVLAAVVFLGLLVVAGALAQQYFTQDALQNQTALDIARSVTPLGALALALGSGIGEEVFFRGFLQPRVGNVATSVLFALAHFSYGSVSEVVVVLALSLLLGLLYKRTGHLLAPIAAHFAFNLIMLLAAQVVPDVA